MAVRGDEKVCQELVQGQGGQVAGGLAPCLHLFEGCLEGGGLCEEDLEGEDVCPGGSHLKQPAGQV